MTTMGANDRLQPAPDRPRILIVEDDHRIAHLLQEVMEEEGWVALGPASHVDQARALIENQRVDFVLLDVNLGRETGFPIAALLEQRNIPFVFLTGHREDILPREFAGHAVLQKPFLPERLVHAIQEVLAGRQRAD
jgi:DNA-binding response OmpR family regulator